MINWRRVESELPTELTKVLWRLDEGFNHHMKSGHYTMKCEDPFRDSGFNAIGDSWADPPTHWCYLSEVI